MDRIAFNIPNRYIGHTSIGMKKRLPTAYSSLCTNADIQVVNKLQMHYKDNPDAGAMKQVTALVWWRKDIPLFTAET